MQCHSRLPLATAVDLQPGSLVLSKAAIAAVDLLQCSAVAAAVQLMQLPASVLLPSAPLHCTAATHHMQGARTDLIEIRLKQKTEMLTSIVFLPWLDSVQGGQTTEQTRLAEDLLSSIAPRLGPILSVPSTFLTTHVSTPATQAHGPWSILTAVLCLTGKMAPMHVAVFLFWHESSSDSSSD